jgi:hypothetical protein
VPCDLSPGIFAQRTHNNAQYGVHGSWIGVNNIANNYASMANAEKGTISELSEVSQ